MLIVVVVWRTCEREGVLPRYLTPKCIPKEHCIHGNNESGRNDKNDKNRAEKKNKGKPICCMDFGAISTSSMYQRLVFYKSALSLCIASFQVYFVPFLEQFGSSILLNLSVMMHKTLVS